MIYRIKPQGSAGCSQFWIPTVRYYRSCIGAGGCKLGRVFKELDIGSVGIYCERGGIRDFMGRKSFTLNILRIVGDIFKTQCLLQLGAVIRRGVSTGD